MLEEAVSVMRELFSGRLISHAGEHYTVDTARLYSVPDNPPQILMSGFGEKAIKMAAHIADGYVCVQPECRLRPAVPRVGRRGVAVQGGLKVRWWRSYAGQENYERLWPNDEYPGEAAQLLPLPRHFRVCPVDHRGGCSAARILRCIWRDRRPRGGFR